LAVVVFVVPGVSLADVPPPPDQGSFAIPDSEDSNGVWIAPAVEVTTTAVGVSWEPGTDPGSVAVRASENGTDWGPWINLDTDNRDHGPDGPTAEAQGSRPASDPIYVGRVEYVQFRGNGSDGIQAEWVETAGRRMNILDRVSHFFDRLTWGERNPVAALTDVPPMVTRAEWGGDACIGPEPHELEFADRVQTIFVHHTNHGGNENGYSSNEVKELIAAICTYHVQVREFWDIGYNFLIDKYGVIYEGRRGGVDSTVIGAHTGGFNSYSTGIGFIGDHGSFAPTPAAQEAFTRLAAWKLDVHHVDPNATVTLESLESTLYPEGQMVTFRTVAGHRDAASTACPGNACYSLINPLRAAVAPIGGPKIYGGWPASEPIEGLQNLGYTPSAFPVRFTEPMSWTISIADEMGFDLASYTGSGTDAAPVWDGTVGGISLPEGVYRSVVAAVPLSGGLAPRPALFEFQLGSYYPPFSDDDESVHRNDIELIFEGGLTAGCGGDRYCPVAPVSRWEMAVFLTGVWNSLGLEFPDYSEAGFEDIGDLSPFARESISRLVQLGLSSGTSPTTFDPHGEVSRWQMALFLSALWRQAGLYDLPSGAAGDRFIDIQELPEHVQLAIGQIAALGITSGTSPTTYSPLSNVTREQMATFLARSLQGLGWSLEAP
jgi:hypothetical protein